MPSVKPTVLSASGRFHEPIKDGDVVGTAFLPMTELLQTVYNEFDEYLQTIIDDPTINSDLPTLLAELLISIQANNGIVKGTDGKLYVDLKAINDRIDNVTSIIHIVGMGDTLPDPSGHVAGDAFIKTNDQDNGGRSWLYILVNGAWVAEGPFELNLDYYATDQELSDALADLRAELEQALAPASITLEDQAASDMLPGVGTTNTEVALQTTRNILKWLKDRVGTSLVDSDLDGIRDSIATNAENIAAKQDTITGAATTITDTDLAASRALISNAAGKVSVSPVTAAELAYLDGVSSSVQTQLDEKQTVVTGAATTIVDVNLTGSRVLVSSNAGKVAVSGVEAAQLEYLQGLTGNIQDQLDNKGSGVSVTPNRALVSDGAGDVAASSVTATELGYLSGAASNIQAQLNTAATTTTAGRARFATDAEVDAAITA